MTFRSLYVIPTEAEETPDETLTRIRGTPPRSFDAAQDDKELHHFIKSIRQVLHSTVYVM